MSADCFYLSPSHRSISRPLLTKLLEIVESAKHDMDVKVDVPARFYAQVEELCEELRTSLIFLTLSPVRCKPKDEWLRIHGQGINGEAP